MKKILFLIFLISEVVHGFSQDSLLNSHKFQLTINIAIPRDYNMRYMQPFLTVIDPVSTGGYSFYNKLGGALTIEYLKKLKSKLFFKAGFDFTLTSLYMTAKGNETLVLHQSYQPVCIFEENDHDITGGILVGSEYLLTSKSSFFLNISPDLFHISFSKLINSENNKGKYISLTTNNFFDTIRFKVGYSYKFYKRFKVFISVAFYSDNLTNPYIGTGLIYEF